MVLHRRAVAGAGLSVGAALGMAGPAQAAIIEVNDDADPGDGVCDITECTLREAIDLANADAVADDITFAAGVTGSIDLDAPSGRLQITEPVNIQGPGAGMLAVDGQDATGLFYIYPATSGDAVTISGLTLSNGFVDEEVGGAIQSLDADLTIDEAVITDNVAGDTSVMSTEDDIGGGIFAGGGALTITDSTISGNMAPEDEGRGGGVAAVYADPVSIIGSTISGNSTAGDDGLGGGAFFYGNDDLAITRSTISGNTANGSSGDAGGIYAYSDVLSASVSIESSTISGNQATDPGVGGGVGAGLYALYETVTIENSTISGNAAGYYGGGVAAPIGATTVTNSTIAANTAYGGGGIAGAVVPGDLENTIVADNTATVGPDLSGDFDAAFSLIEDTSGNPGDVTTAVPNSNVFGQDPLLAALADNGGPDSGAPGMLVSIETQLPLGTSFAVDCGRSFGAVEDQRELARPVQLSPPNSTATGADGADIGAVELQVLGGPGRTTACVPPIPPTPPTPSTPTAAPAPGFNLSAAIKRCKKRFHGKKRKKCIKKQRKKARATIAQPGWPEPRSQRDG